jgi:hypothetical protein
MSSDKRLLYETLRSVPTHGQDKAHHNACVSGESMRYTARHIALACDATSIQGRLQDARERPDQLDRCLASTHGPPVDGTAQPCLISSRSCRDTGQQAVPPPPPPNASTRVDLVNGDEPRATGTASSMILNLEQQHRKLR